MPPVTLELSIPDIICRLRQTPHLLDLVLAGVADADAFWKPAPDRFSIVEVIGHLTLADQHAYRARIERIVTEDTPEVPAFDAESLAAKGTFHADTLGGAAARFKEARGEIMQWLAGLPAETAGRAGMHARVGYVTVREMLHEWVYHDLGHIRQMLELVRARKYHPGMGPFRPHYTPRP